MTKRSTEAAKPEQKPSTRGMKTLEKMEANPKADWKLDQIKSVAEALGINWKSPKSGSHYTFHSAYLQGILTVPFKRPIKSIYVKNFTSMCRAHINMQEKEGEADE